MSPVEDKDRENVIDMCMEQLKSNDISISERNNLFDFLKREVSFNRYYALFREHFQEV